MQYRLYRDAQKYTPSRSGSSSGSSSSEGARRCTEPVIFGENIFPEKRTSKSMVHFSDMIRNGSQYEPDRRPSSSPPPSVVHNEDDDIEDRRKSRDLSGLKIEIITSDAQRHNHTQRPTVTGPTLHQSFERRRSSYRAPSMDLTEALALAPVSLHRRCSTHR